MRNLTTLPALSACALILGLAVGANAALASTATPNSTQRTWACTTESRVTDVSGITGASQGGTASVSFMVGENCNVQLSLVSYKAPAATFSENTAGQQTMFDSTTATLSAGEHTLSVDVPSCFFQIDFVFGTPITTLGPAGSNNFYSAQGRLISAVNGGTSSCSTTSGGTTGGTTGSTGSTGTVIPVNTTPTTTVIPAGPITWAPGFGPNGVVASVQPAPTNTAVAGVQSAPVVASLPSTSTSTDNNGMLAIGVAAVALGVVLLRAKPASVRSRLE